MVGCGVASCFTDGWQNFFHYQLLEFFCLGLAALDDQTIQVIVTPLDGQKVHTEVLTIRDIPERPPRTTRIHISFTMKSIYEVKVTVTDMGFGEIFPSSGQKQEFIIRLDQ